MITITINKNNSNVNNNNKVIPERNHSTDNEDNQDDDQGEDGQHDQQGWVKSTVQHLAVSLRIAESVNEQQTKVTSMDFLCFYHIPKSPFPFVFNQF